MPQNRKHKVSAKKVLAAQARKPRGTKEFSGKDICFQNTRKNLQRCTGHVLSILLSGCCNNRIQGRLTRVEKVNIILDSTRVISICNIVEFSFIPFAYVTNGGSDNVSVIDTTSNTVVATVPIVPDETAPQGVAITPDGIRAYVANNLADNVLVIKTASNTVITTVPVGRGPFGVAITPSCI